MTMGRALYRKYRPTSFEQAVGQNHITSTLQHAIKNGKISHAYLFTGPRGVGKTSVARILAYEVNGLPYNEGGTHLDIIEIDAASNRRIDEIRELRDKVYITPASAKYKVYIIDEVHMLTREAFNALLKTLEEPPAHAIFILATTEVHKLPETIISRTQRYAFKPVDKNQAAHHLSVIAKKEKIDITSKALLLLAEHGQGSFRDSISLLDQLSNQQSKITEETVRTLIGLPSEEAIANLLSNAENGQTNEIVKNLHELINQGVSASAIAKDISKHLRNQLIEGQGKQWTGSLLRELLEVPASSSPPDNLEITLLDFTAKHQPNINSEAISLPQNSSMTKPEIKIEKSNAKKVVTKSQKVAELENNVIEASANIRDFDLSLWPSIVQKVKEQNASLYTALRLAMPHFNEGTLKLYFQFPLHQKKVNQAQQRDKIGNIIEELCGNKLTIECIIDKDRFKNSKDPRIVKIKAPSEVTTGPLNTISSIFGKAEVIES
jgi:DNA polymerase-3 subunit gamma/tau